MNTRTRKTVLSVITSFTLVALVALPAAAGEPNALLIPPHHQRLPEFGFSSFNVRGYGERVTHVRWGGKAARLGIEPGDVIVRLNGFPLTYQGSWNDALLEAVSNSGWVRLTIRDVRTGQLVSRRTYVGSYGGGVGPITPKVHAYNNGSFESHVDYYPHHVGYPVGPFTAKSKVGMPHAGGTNVHSTQATIKEIAKLFD